MSGSPVVFLPSSKKRNKAEDTNEISPKKPKCGSPAPPRLPYVPPEIWVRILRFVRDPPDLAKCVRVNRPWRSFFEEAQIRAERELWWGRAIEGYPKGLWGRAIYEGYTGKRAPDKRPWRLVATTFPFPWPHPRSIDAFVEECSALTPPPKMLLMCRNRLPRVPAKLGNLKDLAILSLSGNLLSTVPPELGGLPKLQVLLLNDNRLTSVPPELENLRMLCNLNLHSNLLETVPRELGKLRMLRHLILSCNLLESVPRELGELQELRTLILSCNRLTSLPPELGKLRRLIVLRADRNRLTSVPRELIGLVNLTHLILHHNQHELVGRGKFPE